MFRFLLMLDLFLIFWIAFLFFFKSRNDLQTESVKTFFIGLGNPSTLFCQYIKGANIHFVLLYAKRSFMVTLKIWKQEKST